MFLKKHQLCEALFVILIVRKIQTCGAYRNNFTSNLFTIFSKEQFNVCNIFLFCFYFLWMSFIGRHQFKFMSQRFKAFSRRNSYGCVRIFQLFTKLESVNRISNILARNNHISDSQLICSLNYFVQIRMFPKSICENEVRDIGFLNRVIMAKKAEMRQISVTVE
jgi:hypothetical protein